MLAKNASKDDLTMLIYDLNDLYNYIPSAYSEVLSVINSTTFLIQSSFNPEFEDFERLHIAVAWCFSIPFDKGIISSEMTVWVSVQTALLVYLKSEEVYDGKRF